MAATPWRSRSTRRTRIWDESAKNFTESAIVHATIPLQAAERHRVSVR